METLRISTRGVHAAHQPVRVDLGCSQGTSGNLPLDDTVRFTKKIVIVTQLKILGSSPVRKLFAHFAQAWQVSEKST